MPSQLSNEAKALLLLARVNPSAAHREALGSLLPSLDGLTIVEAAENQFVLPLASQLLGRLDDRSSGDDCFSVAAREALRARSRVIAMQTMQLVRVQQYLVSEIFDPCTIDYAFFKGAAMARELYGRDGMRQFRDVDVLVEASRIADVGKRLLALGYEITNPAWQTFRSQDLRNFCACESALELRSPLGELVELHRTLDSTGCIFDPRQLLANAKRAGASAGWRVLDFDDHVVYACYHHARHRWSSLHWCSDLEAMVNDVRFDADRILAHAERCSLRRTVEEALLLGENLTRLCDGSDPGDLPRCSLYLEDCLTALHRSLEASDALPSSEAATAAEDSPASSQVEPDFPYDWQLTPEYRRRLARRRWRPDANDVNAVPLPYALFWLHYFLRPLRVFASRVWLRARSTPRAG